MVDFSSTGEVMESVATNANGTCPKILLVTWTPPGDGNVGEIILRDLCGLLPEGSIHVIEVSDFPERQAAYPGMRLNAPSERPWRPLPGRLGGLLNHLRVRTRFRDAADRLVSEIAAYAHSHGIEKIWLTLSTQTLIRVGSRLAIESGLPVLCLVWDPPDWLARHVGWDGASVRWSLKNFDAAMRASVGAMVVSDNMVERYADRYSIPCTIVRHAFDIDGLSPAVSGENQELFRVGFAGTMYDQGQFNCLLEALNRLEWRIAGKPVALRMIGNFYRFTKLSQPARVELLGWRGTEETRSLLSECDLTYLPISFQDKFDEFARLAFPTKLSAYFAAGRQVLVHAPEYAAPVGMCRERDFGIACTSMEPEQLARALVDAGNSELASQRAERVRLTCVELFSRPVMRRQFAKFLSVHEANLHE